MVTITNPEDVDLAVERGVDALCVQGIEAGAHRGGFTDDEGDDGYGVAGTASGAVREKTGRSAIGRGRSDHGRPRPGCCSPRRCRSGTGSALRFCAALRAEPTRPTRQPWPTPPSPRRRSRELSVAGAHTVGQPVHGRPSVGAERVSADQRRHPAATCRSSPTWRSAPHELVGGAGFLARRSTSGGRDRGSHHDQLPRRRPRALSSSRRARHRGIVASGDRGRGGAKTGASVTRPTIDVCWPHSAIEEHIICIPEQSGAWVSTSCSSGNPHAALRRVRVLLRRTVI